MDKFYDENGNIISGDDIDYSKEKWTIKGDNAYRTPLSVAERQARLREEREHQCFKIINRGNLWYETLTDSQKAELKEWYQKWLDVTKTLEVPEKPEWLK